MIIVEGDRWFHMAVSVDVDRFGDRYIRRCWLPIFRDQLGCKTPKDVRQHCEMARRKGYEVFPPCDNYGPDGKCLWHNRENQPSQEQDSERGAL